MQNLIIFIVGFIFALGLGISGMTLPSKVIGFLDLKGDWDASLMFVMLGAIPIHMLAYRLIKGKTAPVLDVKFYVPTSREINKPLIVGSIIFGIGWGLGGICPGPALATLVTGAPYAFAFVGAMLVGMYLEKKWA